MLDLITKHCKNRRILHHSSHHTSHTSDGVTDSGGTGTSRNGISNTNDQQAQYITASQISTKQSITAGTVITSYQLLNFEEATI